MAKPSNPRSRAVLSVRDLHVHYGASHALQGVDLTLDEGVHAVVGRNGMGKTTLCNAIMGLVPATRGSIRFDGQDILGVSTNRIAASGVGYTPQGRRLWPSLTVDEHLRMCAMAGASWTVDRIYDTFPRLAERRRNGGGQLSGGEQQMLAISRALLQDPHMLLLDEPTEGLAPVIVQQVERMLISLAQEGDVAILLVEQNIGVATAVAKDVAIMVNGRIASVLPAAQLGADRALQQRLLGVGRQDDDALPVPPTTLVAELDIPQDEDAPAASPSDPGTRKLAYVPPTRWSSAAWKARDGAPLEASPAHQPALEGLIPGRSADPTPLHRSNEPMLLVAGTFDTKGDELMFIRKRLLDQKIKVKTIDLSTSGKPSRADIPPGHVAAFHPRGGSAVFSGDRGQSVRAMKDAFLNWTGHHPGIAGIISAGGSGGTALVTPAMRALPIGVPKVMISTVASGDVGQYVGPSDITMMYSVTDVQGLNQISRKILANGADAFAGMVRRTSSDDAPVEDKPALGLSMFGVTTTAIQQITAQLDDTYDCLVFHATGVGGRSMEKLVESGLISAAIDLTTTEICDMMMGGIFAADDDRFGAFIRTKIPYIGSVGALDMVNFAAPETVPDRYAGRTFVEHNPQVTLMRTTASENSRMGEWIAERLNRMEGPVRFLIPEAGVSALDAPGMPFHDPEADQALFEALTKTFKPASNRQMIKLPHHINDPAFADACAAALRDIAGSARRFPHATV